MEGLPPLGGANGPDGVRLVREPGSEWSYSGGGFALLQLMIEEVTGQPFGDYMRQAVFEPAGMSSTTFEQAPRPEIAERIALAHDGDGIPMVRRRFTAVSAAGLLTTLQDLERWTLAELRVGPAKDAVSDTLLEWSREPSAVTASYAAGRQLRAVGDTTLVGHVGTNRGWYAHLEFVPETRAGLIVLTSGGNGFTFHNALMCEWIRSTTGGWRMEFCQTGLLSRLAMLRDRIELLCRSEPELVAPARATEMVAQVEAVRSHLRKREVPAAAAILESLIPPGAPTEIVQRAAAIRRELARYRP